MQDRRCRLGLAARIDIVKRRRAGQTFRQIAEAIGCSASTAKTQCDRWQQASEAEREDFSCLAPRRPVPRSCPWALSVEVEQAILHAREKTGWGPMRLSVVCGGRHRSSIWKVLKRHEKSRLPKPGRQTFKRFEWSQAGALLHIDAFSVQKFDTPGHRITGDRDKTGRARGLGKHVVIAIQDDFSRLVYAELHHSENAVNAAATLRRGAAWMTQQGCGPAEAVLSDNAKCYAQSRVFAQALAELGARHILTPPYTPRWNGKLERFWGTLNREWASRPWPNSQRRDRALSSYLRYYNRQRPHSAAGGRAPITRVQQV